MSTHTAASGCSENKMKSNKTELNGCLWKHHIRNLMGVSVYDWANNNNNKKTLSRRMWNEWQTVKPIYCSSFHWLPWDTMCTGRINCARKPKTLFIIEFYWLQHWTHYFSSSSSFRAKQLNLWFSFIHFDC